MKIQIFFTFIALSALMVNIASAKCVYHIKQDYYPIHADNDPFQVGALTACKDYIEPGRLGCCNRYNDEATLKNFKQIDGIFGAQGGGCDICAINLKRFWCQYACSARQSQFMWSAKEYEEFPDPQKPGNTLMGQRVWVRVHADTACALYNACKRNPFVSSVSAMSSPAGFLNFQGHNAINDGHQYVSMNFSYNLNDSLSFTDQLGDFAYASLTTCQTKAAAMREIHNFTFTQNCTCNTCGQACDPNDGFVYTESSILQDFNYKLVGGAYAFTIIVSGVITFYRWRKSKRE